MEWYFILAICSIIFGAGVIAFIAFSLYDDNHSKKPKQNYKVSENKESTSQLDVENLGLCGTPFLNSTNDRPFVVADMRKQCLECIDNFWSWSNDNATYERYKSFVPQINRELSDRLISLSLSRLMSTDDKEEESAHIMLHCFALSYYLVTDMDNILLSYDRDSVINALTDVFFENGYVGENSKHSFNTINVMLAEKNTITEKVFKKLGNHSSKNSNGTTKECYSTEYASVTEFYTEAFDSITKKPVAMQCTNYKPLTAAYLFMIADLTMNNAGEQQLRNIETTKIFNFLSGSLTNAELNVFDSAVKLFAGVIQGNIIPHGSWCMDKTEDGWFLRLFICYGDLMRYPGYIYNYTSSYVKFNPTEEALTFMSSFIELQERVLNYTQKVCDFFK